MADTGDNPSSDEKLSNKERERRFKNHLQCKRTLIIVSKKPFSFLLFIQLFVGPLVGLSSSESASSYKMTTIATSLAAIFV